jgi:hypothetical protein
LEAFDGSSNSTNLEQGQVDRSHAAAPAGEVCSIRAKLQLERRMRDLELFAQ